MLGLDVVGRPRPLGALVLGLAVLDRPWPLGALVLGLAVAGRPRPLPAILLGLVVSCKPRVGVLTGVLVVAVDSMSWPLFAWPSTAGPPPSPATLFRTCWTWL